MSAISEIKTALHDLAEHVVFRSPQAAHDFHDQVEAIGAPRISFDPVPAAGAVSQLAAADQAAREQTADALQHPGMSEQPAAGEDTTPAR